MAIGHWINLRTGILVVLASLVAVLAVLFGNAYAIHGHEEEAEHAEEEGAGAEAPKEEEHAEEGEGDEGSRSVKIAGSILISTAGAGLVPLGLLLARRRPREERTSLPEAQAPVTGPPEPAGDGIESVLRPALALLSAGAAVIHFVVIPGHWDEYWAQGLFFIVAAIAQFLWAVWIVIAPSRLIYLAGAAGNTAIAALWVVTRTAGVPAGPGAGEREAVEFADTLATAFEVALVIGALTLARTARVRPVYWPRGAPGASAVVGLAVAALTAASLLSLAELWMT